MFPRRPPRRSQVVAQSSSQPGQLPGICRGVGYCLSQRGFVCDWNWSQWYCMAVTKYQLPRSTLLLRRKSRTSAASFQLGVGALRISHPRYATKSKCKRKTFQTPKTQSASHLSSKHLHDKVQPNTRLRPRHSLPQLSDPLEDHHSRLHRALGCSRGLSKL